MFPCFMFSRVSHNGLRVLANAAMRLRELELQNCAVTDSNLRQLVKGCKKLTRLNLGECALVRSAGEYVLACVRDLFLLS